MHRPKPQAERPNETARPWLRVHPGVRGFVHIEGGEISRQLQRAVGGGQLSAETLTAFLDGQLYPALTGNHHPVDRRATYRAARIIRRHLEHTN